MTVNGKKTILAIDDQIPTLTTIRTILEGAFEVCLAKNAEIAQTILKTTDVDMILMDMEMPGLSGIDFLELIHKDPAYYQIPIIIVSSHGTPDVIIQAKKAGAMDFVVKPLNSAILLEKIHAAFKSSTQKISRDALFRKLSTFESLCKQGKSSRVEAAIEELEQVHCDMVIDARLAEIIKHAKDLDYNLVIEKVGKLLRGQ